MEERGEVCTEFWWGNLMEKDYLKDLDLQGKIILKCFLSKSCEPR